MDNNRNILSIMRGEINDFLYNSIEVVPGYTFNQYDTIKQCHLYLNSKFLDDSLYQGQIKYFDNKITAKRDRVAAFLNIDTKDVKAISKSGSKNPFKTLISQKELDNYMKENDYAQKFNDMADEAVDYGSVVIKKTKKGDEIVDLRYMFIDPTVSNLQKSRFLTFKHRLTSTELRAKTKDGWDEKVIEAIIEKKERELNMSNAGTSYEQNGQLNMIRSTPYIEVYERFGEVEKGLLAGKGQDKELVKALFIVAECMSYSKDTQGQYMGENGGILFKSEWKGEYPVDEYHYKKVKGRWLGQGVVEALFLPQERMNELANQKRVSMELSTLHLFQTQDSTVVNNLLTDLQNGDIIITGPTGQITPVVNEERNLAAFQSEEIHYQEAIDSISFVSPQAGGEAVPSSTPATSVVVQQNNTLSVFNFRRQNFANFIRRYLRKHVLKNLLREMSVEHVLRFAGDYDEMTRITQAIATSHANTEVKNKMMNGAIISPEEYQGYIVRNMSLLKKKGELHLQINESWFDDIDLDFDILIDNEQQATDVLAQNKYQIIQILSSNPNALLDPVTRALIFDYAEDIGINPTKLESLDMGQQMAQGQQQLPQGQAQQAPVGQGALQPAQVA